jgi:acetate kinase
MKSKKILVINCGSSSLKYEVYDMPSEKSLGKGLVERIGETMGHIE